MTEMAVILPIWYRIDKIKETNKKKKYHLLKRIKTVYEVSMLFNFKLYVDLYNYFNEPCTVSFWETVICLII